MRKVKVVGMLWKVTPDNGISPVSDSMNPNKMKPKIIRNPGILISTVLGKVILRTDITNTS